MAIAVSTGLKPKRPLAMNEGSALKIYAIISDMAEAIAAHTAAKGLAIARPIRKSRPVTHELMRNTCEMPLSQYVASDIMDVSETVDSGVAIGASRPRIDDAKSNIQVVATKGKVRELRLIDASSLLRPERPQVLIAAPKISSSHICHVLAKNVGNAQPTSMPLKPHKPSQPDWRSWSEK